MALKRLAGCCVAASVLVACGGGSVPDEGGPTARMESDPGDQLLDQWAWEAESQEGPQLEPLSKEEKRQLKLNESATLNQQTLEDAKAAQGSLGFSDSKSAVAAKSAHRVSVYRFYNLQTRAHFYTTSETERDSVQATLPQFSYEGIAFHVSCSTAQSATHDT